MVSFKIGSYNFTHKFIVCEGLNRPFILEEFFIHHCFTLGWIDDNKRFTQYRGNIIAVVSQAVMDDRTHSVKYQQEMSPWLPLNAQICFQVQWKITTFDSLVTKANSSDNTDYFSYSTPWIFLIVLLSIYHYIVYLS